MACIITPIRPTTVNPAIISHALLNVSGRYYQCMGIDTSGQMTDDLGWLRNWSSGFCDNVLDGVDYSLSQQTMLYIIDRYYSSQNFSLSPYNVPQPESGIIRVCKNYPGSCEVGQESMCNNCSIPEISREYGLIQFCGCFGSQATTAATPEIITPECVSTCANSFSIKRAGSDGRNIECTQTVCVMNNISIEASNSTFTNSTISQVCSNCLLSGGCKCFIDVSLPQIAKTLGITGDNNVLNTYCEDATCYTIDPDIGISTNVDCATYNIDQTVPIKIEIPTGLWWVVIVLLFIGVIVVFSLWFWGNDFKVEKFEWNYKNSDYSPDDL